MAVCLIYSLVDPRSGAVRYIGKSTYGIRRAKEHGFESQLLKWPGHKANWIRGLQRAGLQYRIDILESCSEKHLLGDRERYWIAHGRAIGWPLTNMTDGGDGTPGVLHNPERAARISAALTGRKRPPFSAEWRAKIGAAMRGRKMPPKSAETLARMGASHRGTKASAETRAKMSAAHKGKPSNISAEGRARINAAMAKRRGVPLTEEHRAKLWAGPRKPLPPRTPEHSARIGAAQRGRKLPPRTPEHSAAISAALRAMYAARKSISS